MNLTKGRMTMKYLGLSEKDYNHLISASANELIGISKSTIGLSDFGDNAWEKRFYNKIEDLDDAKLHPLAKFSAKIHALVSLNNRLLVTDRLKKEPKIADETINQPILITGMPRTGTTLTHEILARDSKFRALINSDAMFPTSEPFRYNNTTINSNEFSKKYFELNHELSPKNKAMHEIDWNLPTESKFAMTAAFPDFNFSNIDYNSWKKEITNDFKYYYNWHKITLQILQSGHPSKRWIISDARNLYFLDILLQYYPDIKIIHLHRDPLKSIPSILNYYREAHLAIKKTDEEIQKSVFGVIRQCESSLKSVIDSRASGFIPEKQITDIHFDMLMTDPKKAIHDAYQNLDLDFPTNFGNEIKDYLFKKPRYRHGKYSYNMSDYDFSDSDIRDVFRFYTDYYDITLNV